MKNREFIEVSPPSDRESDPVTRKRGPYARILFSAAFVAAASLLFFHLWTRDLLKSMDFQRKAGLTQLVHMARNSIEPVVQGVRSGETSKEDALSAVRDRVRRLVYEDQYGPNYIFMSAYDGTMLVQPFEPGMEMNNQWDLQDVHGIYIIRELVETARSHTHGGFVRYHYYPPGQQTAQEKLAFVMGIPELQCYIGTGMYMQQALLDQLTTLDQAKYWALLLVLLITVSALISVREVGRRNRMLMAEMTEKEKAKESLALSEQNLRQVFHDIYDALIVQDPEGRILEVNDRMLSMFRLPRERIREYTIAEISARENNQQERLSGIWQRAMSGENLVFEWKALRPHDGSVFDVEVSLRHSRWFGRGVLIAVVRDVSDRKRVEDALHASEAKYRELVQHARSIILRMDPHGSVTFFNEFAQEFFGFSEDEIIGRNVVGTIVPEVETSGRDLKALLQDICNNPDSYYTNENENMHKDGRRMWVTWTNKAVRDPNGVVQEILCVGVDITAYKRADEALRESRRMLRSVLDTIPVRVFWKDLNSLYLGCNRAFARDAGFSSPSDIVGRSDHEMAWAEQAEQYLADDRLVMESGRPRLNYEEFQTTPDGTRIVLRTSKIPLFDDDGKVRGLLGTYEDITEEERAAEERAVLEKQLLHARKLESVGRLAGGIAHDFNNMLSPILGYSEILLDSMSENDPLRGDMKEILSAGRRARDLTRQLLAFARRQTLEVQPIDLNEVITGFHQMLRRTIRENVNIRFEPAPCPVVFRGDVGQVEQVILNLALNAQDAMREGGTLLLQTGMVELDDTQAKSHQVLEAGPCVMLAVTDTGAGMDQQTAERVFEPFFTTKELGRGTGLGLATVYGIVKQHSGSISVHSEPGNGTTFRVFFPQVKEKAVSLGSDQTASKSLGGNETILVAEDQEQVRTLAAQILTQHGYKVLTAPDGKTALELVASHPSVLHLLVTDVIMPDMNGKALYEKMAPLVGGLKVLFMSGYTADVIDHHGVLDTGCHFIQKPFSLKEFVAKVREALYSAGT